MARRRKYAPKKRVYKRRVIYRGGALGDYIPSLSTLGSAAGTAASYLPGAATATSYYNQGKEYYNTGIQAANTAKKAYDLYKEYQPVIDPFLAANSPKAAAGPPPIPSGGPPPLSARDKAFNARVKAGDIKTMMSKPTAAPSARAVAPSAAPTASKLPGSLGQFYNLGRQYKPISKIDNALRTFGLRDKVRGFLDRKGLGALNNIADGFIQQGFGRRRVIRRVIRHRVYRVARTKRPAAIAYKSTAVVQRGGVRRVIVHKSLF